MEGLLTRTIICADKHVHMVLLGMMIPLERGYLEHVFNFVLRNILSLVTPILVNVSPIALR